MLAEIVGVGAVAHDGKPAARASGTSRRHSSVLQKKQRFVGFAR